MDMDERKVFSLGDILFMGKCLQRIINQKDYTWQTAAPLCFSKALSYEQILIRQTSLIFLPISIKICSWGEFQREITILIQINKNP
jgi:hypothetical protein